MKLKFVVVAVCLITAVVAVVLEEEEDDDQLTESSIARPHWQDIERTPEAGKEEREDGEEGGEPRRRPRPGGKRRRRLRKRPRTTTEAPVEDAASEDKLHWQKHPEVAEFRPQRQPPVEEIEPKPHWREPSPQDEEDVKPRRRPGKRRRRPLRKPEEEEEGPPRRKAVRKRPRPVQEDSSPEVPVLAETPRPQGFKPPPPEPTTTELPSPSPSTFQPPSSFDRKALFSTSLRRLPPTSAVIRRRLRPGTNGTKNLVPPGYAQSLPVTIPPRQLIDQMMAHSTEEPNYPKIPSTTSTKPTTTTTTTTSPPPPVHRRATVKVKLDFMVDDLYKIGKAPEVTTTQEPKPIEEAIDQEDDNLDVTNVEDHILDLLMTENGSTRLAKILELRNMTLIQLIQHRERGSSQLHLSDIFTKDGKLKSDEELQLSTGKSVEFEEVKPEVREPRIFESMPNFGDTIPEGPPPNPTWRIIPNPKLTPVSPHGVYREIPLTKATKRPYHDIDDIVLIDGNDLEGGYSVDTEFTSRFSDSLLTFRKFPPGVKSAIIVSAGILVLAIIGFLSVLVSCRVRQKRSRIRAKQDVLCEQLHNEDFMNSQRSLSPVLNKNQQPAPVFSQGIHSNTTSNRHYYLWRTLRKTFQYD